MNESPGKFRVNPPYEDDNKPTSMESFQLNAFRIQTEEESGHSNDDHRNLYEALNFEKAKPAQGSNRALLALVIILCLISLVALLLTLLMLVGKIGPSNEGSDSASMETYLAKMKALEENMTSLQLGLMVHLDTAFTELRTHLNRTDNDLEELKNIQIKTDAGYHALRDDLNMTRNQLLMSDTVTKDTVVAVNTTLALRLENHDSVLNELKFALKKTNAELAERNSTYTKGKVIYHQTMTPSWIEAHASYIDALRGYTTEQLTFYTGTVFQAALFKVPMIPVNVLQNSTPLTVKIVVSNNVTIGENDPDSDMIYGVSDGISFVGFELVDKNTYKIKFPPCFGQEGIPLNSSLKEARRVSSLLPRPRDTFYPGQCVGTLNLNERWGACYTAHDGGFVKTAVYNKRLTLSKGLTFEVYKNHEYERVGIKYIEVTIIQDS